MHLEKQRLEVIPAFIESWNGESERYEQPLESFMESGRILVVAAYGVQFLPDGRELYGLDTAVEAIARLASERADLRLALFIARRPASQKARRHLARLEKRVEQAGLSERVHVAFDRPLGPALRKNVIFIRPAREDGDALSVREAQRAGVPVVASDVVERPSGVVLFPTDDVATLCSALGALLARALPNVPTARRDARNHGSKTFSDRLIELYRSELAAQE